MNYIRLVRIATLMMIAVSFCTYAGAITSPQALPRHNSAADTPQLKPLRVVPAPKIEKISLAQSAILGVVEGITEYLPVSSTGHLILTGQCMGLVHYSDQTGFFGRLLDKERMKAIDSFEIVIQLGAILAVVGLYRRRVEQMCLGVVGRDRQGRKLLILLLVAFVPAAIVGFLFHKKIEANLFGPVPVAWALAVGGVLMIAVEYFYRRHQRVSDRWSQSIDDMMLWQAVVIGFAQCLAMWPGTSRSMITMLAAMMVGMNIVAAAEFSFLLALPTLGAATLFSAMKDWKVLREAAGIDGMLIGLIVSGIVAAIAVKAFVKWLTRHGLTPFGVYRIIAAGLVFWLVVR